MYKNKCMTKKTILVNRGEYNVYCLTWTGTGDQDSFIKCLEG